MELWGHQKRAISNAAGKDYYALFFEMGTGKTRTVTFYGITACLLWYGYD